MLVNRMRIACIGCLALTLAATDVAIAAPATADDSVITVVRDVAIQWSEASPEVEERDGMTVLDQGQAVQKVVGLPAAPANQREARRITARLIVEPVPIEKDGKITAGDPWTRLGRVSLILPGEAAKKSKQDGLLVTPEKQVELLRFITGFGGRAEYTADLTALAPLLQGRATLRVFISTFASPAWKVTLTLTYSSMGVGQRRPEWAAPLFCEEAVTAAKNKLRTSLTVPKGLEQPRLLITSTGHATDGTGGDEFISRTHILRIDGVEVARWRPWAEDGGPLRGANPASGRNTIDGRERWVSDLDRAGWHPGMIVQPLRIPAPELTPGKHSIELEIVGIRAADPNDAKGDHGYWRTCAIAVADEPWPDDDASTD